MTLPQLNGGIDGAVTVDGHEQLAVERAEEHTMTIVVGSDGQGLLYPGPPQGAARAVCHPLHIAVTVPAGPDDTQTSRLCAKGKRAVGHRTGVPRSIVSTEQHTRRTRRALHIVAQRHSLDRTVAILNPLMTIEQISLSVGVGEERRIQRAFRLRHVSGIAPADEGVRPVGQATAQDVHCPAGMSVGIDRRGVGCKRR